MMKPPSNLVLSIDRALTILEEVAKSDKGIGVTQLSNQLGIHKSTVHRLLATLQYRGYIEQNEETENYRLGLKVMELGNRVFNGIEIRPLAHPYLQELMKRTKETVHLVIRDGNKGVYVDKVESPETIRMASRIGFRAPLYCTAVGKVLLSELSEEKISNLLSESDLKPLTENTITRWNEFLFELSKIREQGYAIDHSEHERDVHCVAAPVKNFNGTIVAAVSVSAPAFRLPEELFEEVALQVRENALRISKQMGYMGE